MFETNPCPVGTRRTLRRRGPVTALAAIGLAGLLALAPAATAQVPERANVLEEGEAEGVEPGLFSVERIELTTFGGRMWGADYLALPDIFDPDRTFDTGANDIQAFSPDTDLRGIRAPRKTIEDGIYLGGAASFYLSPNFAMQLFGQYGQSEAVITGLRGDGSEDRVEYDRSDVTMLSGGGNILYHIGKEKKRRGGRKLFRPYVNLGFGGILNKFPETDDATSVYFLYGGGISTPLGENFRAQLGANFQLFTWETEETSLDETITIPTVGLQLVWRYDVPPPVVEEAPGAGDDPAADASGTSGR